ANLFLNERYIGEFNAKFTVAAKEEGTAFRKTTRSDLNWVFTVQTERVVDRDNTVAIGDQSWQLEKSKFRHSLAKSTVTIHEHLDGTVSIRFGPHVVGRYTAEGAPLPGGRKARREGRGKGGPVEAVENRRAVSHRSHRPVEIPPSRDSHFSTATNNPIDVHPRKRKPASASKRGASGSIN
ncbi:MAG TPA: hypothetical protein VGL77_05700, partial [Armatimonadota bacterium]